MVGDALIKAQVTNTWAEARRLGRTAEMQRYLENRIWKTVLSIDI